MYALIIRKNLQQHALSSGVTALSIALASGLLMSIFAIQHQARTTFAQVTGGYDAVLGARGSKLQLVLNAVFHLDESPGNLRWTDFTNALHDPNVQAAVPLALGDNYQGYRVVGVTTNVPSDTGVTHGSAVELQPPGRSFDPARREARAGSVAA